MEEPVGRFIIPSLDLLMLATSIDEVWRGHNNDQFFALQRYTKAATGIVIEGYGSSSEVDGALEAVHRTADELSSVLGVLNGLPALLALPTLGHRDERDGVRRKLQDSVEGALADAGVSPGLATTIVRELSTWPEPRGRVTSPLDLSPLIRFTNAGPPPAAEPDPQETFSSSVRQVRADLGPDRQVRAVDIARLLQKLHPEYVSHRFASVDLTSVDGLSRPVDDWLQAVRGLYDPSAVASSRHQVIDGELVVLGLAELDPGLRDAFGQGGFGEALGLSVEVRPAATLPAASSRPALLAGANADTVPEPGEGRVLSADRLELAAEVEMLVSVLLARTTPLPLAIALLGDWGSGKSFFMALTQERMAELSRLARAGRPEADAFCRQVRIVRFNAWHYVDTDLWSSLAVTLFDALARGDTPPTDEKVKRLVEARTALEKAARSRRRAEQEVASEKAKARRPGRQLGALLAAARDDSDLWAKLKGGAGSAADVDLGDDKVNDLITAIRPVRGVVGSSVVLVKLLAADLRSKQRRPTLFALAVAAMLVAVVWWVAHTPTAVNLVVTVVAAIGAAGAAMPAIRGVTRIMSVARSARQKQEAELKAKEAALAEASLAERSRQGEVAELEREIDQQRTRGQRLRELVGARSTSADYRSRLGVISLLRADFEQLAALLSAEEGLVPHGSADDTGEPVPQLPVTDRIVLFIDDLDRCPAERVIDVLQAVHLLLAFKLFVVVVGVDSRWLERSLRAHYQTLLAEPDDYLDKIFQVSFALRPMTPPQFAELIDALAPTDLPSSGPDRDGSSGRSDLSPGEPREGVAADGERGGAPRPVTTETGNRGDDGSSGSTAAPPRPEALRLTSEERALLAELGRVVGTPRLAKRLMNVYRMLRVSVTDEEYKRFLPGEGDEYQVVVVLLGLVVGQPELARSVCTAILRAAPEDDLGGVLAAVPGAKWALEPLVGELTVTTCGPYQRWVPRVARFSFRLAPSFSPYAPARSLSPVPGSEQ